MAKLFRGATSADASPAALSALGGLVEDGNPLAIFEFDEQELQSLPEQAETIELPEIPGASLAYVRLRPKSSTDWIGAWFIRRGSADENRLRSLRLCLLRLNAERESLDIVLNRFRRNMIEYQPQTERGDDFEDYLRNALKFLDRTTWSKVPQSAIVQALNAAASVQRPDDQQALFDQYKGARLNVRRRVERYERTRQEKREVTVVNEHGKVVIMNDNSRYHETQTTVTNGDVNTLNLDGGNLTNSPINQGRGTQTATITIQSAEVAKIKPDELKAALNELYDMLDQAGLERAVKQKAQTAAGNAINAADESPKSEDAAKGMVSHVKAVGDTLKEANVAVKEGSTLWASIKKVADVVGPVVGTAATVLAWFV